MPDKKLTDNEIIKALECCSNYGLFKCIQCPKRGTGKTCMYDLSKEAVGLINRLQAENERQKNFKAYFDFYFGCDIEILGIDENGDTTSFDEFYNCAIANAESIEHHIAHIIKTAKSEAYKEFAEKVKQGFFSNSEQDVLICGVVDNILKEMAGENNA